MAKLAAILISAHMIGDFLAQPRELVARKARIGYLLLHSLFHAALVYVTLQMWKGWEAPLFVFVIHGVIDYIEQGEADTTTAFVIDQGAHASSLLALSWLLVHYWLLVGHSGCGYKQLVVFAGFIATVRGTGFLVEKFPKRLMDENQLKLDGLRNGGRIIGQLERALIFLFIFTGQSAGIGFLVAAKSVLRFEETKKQQLAEYVLIGTLLSFSLAIAMTTTTKWAMGL